MIKYKQLVYIYFIYRYQILDRMQNKMNILDNESETNKFEYNNAFSFDQEFQEDDDRVGQLKNQYSTFIQELEETTEKLMNQVFSSDYKNEPDDRQSNISAKKIHNKTHQTKRYKMPSFSQKDTLSTYRNQATARHSEAQSYTNQKFADFMVRNNKWLERKHNFIKKQVEKKEILQNKQLTFVPKIIRGSIQKLQPIYERALQIHASKEKKKAYMKIEQKKKQEEQYNSLPFHPSINEKNKTRSLQEYLKDKQQWQKKKIQKRQFKKLKKQAEEVADCFFTPTLISKQILPTSSRLKLGEKVQDRLIRSLEKSFDQI